MCSLVSRCDLQGRDVNYLTGDARQQENSNKFETCQKWMLVINNVMLVINNVTISCFGNETVLRVKPPPGGNSEFSHYREYLQNREINRCFSLLLEFVP